jgi:hypothetical protein
MGKYLFLLLFPVISIAQQVELSIKPEVISSFTNVATTNDGYYLVKKLDNLFWLTKTDFNGDVIWEREIFGENLIDFKVKPNGDVIIISSDYECGGMWDGQEECHMTIFSTNGNPYFQKNLTWNNFGADDYYIPYTKSKKGNEGVDWRIVFNGDSIFKITDTGEILFRIGSPEGHFQNILYAFLDSRSRVIISVEERDSPNYKFIYVGDTMGNYTVEFNCDEFALWGNEETITSINELASGSCVLFGDVTDVYEIDNLYILSENNTIDHFWEVYFYQVDSNIIYVLGSNSFAKIYETGNYEQVDLSNELWEISSLSKRNDTLFIAGHKNNSASIVFLDTSLNVLNSASIDDVSINDCSWGDSLIIIAGEETYFSALDYDNNLVNLPSTLLKSLDYQFNTIISEEDAKITNCAVDTSYVIWTPDYDRVYTQLSLSLHNNGEAVLKELTISLHYGTKIYGDSCGYAAVHLYQLDSLNILPGNDSIIIVGPISFTTSSNSTIEVTTCAYVYSPNERLDADHSNNKCCANHSISLGINDPSTMLSMTIEVFPNPATEEVTINGYAPSYLKLSNTHGQTVAEANNTNKLWLGNLPQGLYLLQLFDEKGGVVKTERVVKE